MEPHEMDFLIKAMEASDDEGQKQIIDATLDAARPKMEMSDSKLENTLFYCIDFVGGLENLAAILAGVTEHEKVRNSSRAVLHRHTWLLTISHSDFWNGGGLWSPLGYPSYWSGWDRELSKEGGPLEQALIAELEKLSEDEPWRFEGAWRLPGRYDDETWNDYYYRRY